MPTFQRSMLLRKLWNPITTLRRVTIQKTLTWLPTAVKASNLVCRNQTSNVVWSTDDEDDDAKCLQLLHWCDIFPKSSEGTHLVYTAYNYYTGVIFFLRARKEAILSIPTWVKKMASKHRFPTPTSHFESCTCWSRLARTPNHDIHFVTWLLVTGIVDFVHISL